MHIKQFVKTAPTEDENEGQMSFIASTDRADRYGDVIDQRGWNLDDYKANPVVLLNHDHQSLPIGRGNVRTTEAGLVIDVEFDMADPKAAEIAGKASRGFMSAVSVGFAPKKSIARADLPESHFAYSKSGGQYFEQAELLEVSIVTIPANADAVAIAAKSYGTELKKFIYETIFTIDLIDFIDEHVQNNIQAYAKNLKHILNISEDESTVTVVYAKPEIEEQEEIVEEGYNDSKKEEEDEEMKHLVKALLSLEGDY